MISRLSLLEGCHQNWYYTCIRHVAHSGHVFQHVHHKTSGLKLTMHSIHALLVLLCGLAVDLGQCLAVLTNGITPLNVLQGKAQYMLSITVCICA
jgi:hypothetical protein